MSRNYKSQFGSGMDVQSSSTGAMCSRPGVPHRKQHIPTAKVPAYTNRFGQDMRDDKPPLLPTPDIAPMRPQIAQKVVRAASTPVAPRLYTPPYSDGEQYASSQGGSNTSSLGDEEVSFYENEVLLTGASYDNQVNLVPITEGQILDLGNTVEQLLSMLAQESRGVPASSSFCNNVTECFNLPSCNSPQLDSDISLDSIAGFYFPETPK